MGPPDQQRFNFLDKINSKVIKSNSSDCQGSKYNAFKLLREPLNFVVFAILSKFLIPEFAAHIESANQWKPKFLDKINLKVIKSNRWTIRDTKINYFHCLRESLNFIVFVVLANFLIH